MAIEEDWLIASSPAACKSRDIVNAVLVFCGNGSSVAILSLRTWAIWDRSVTLKWFLLITSPISMVIFSVCFFFIFRHSPYTRISGDKLTCYAVIEESYWLTIVYVVRVIMSTKMVGLVLIKAIRARHSNSKWVFRIHYTGVVYYLYILLMSIANVAITVHLHNVGLQSFSIIQGTLYSVLSNRVIFLAREPSELEFCDCDMTYTDGIYE